MAIARPDVVVLAGDIDVGTRAVAWAHQAFAGLPVLYVSGNHESYGECIDKVQWSIANACAETRHVHYLARNELVIGGVRFLGATLWTDFRLYGDEIYPIALQEAARSMNDYRRIRLQAGGGRPVTPHDTERWHAEDRAWLEERLGETFEGKTVVVTHMAPSKRSIERRYQGDILSPAFASNLDHLVEKADLWIHGHVHSSFDYAIGSSRVVCNPLGYPIGRPENQTFDPDLTVEI